ncbi:MAG: hypothetical protein KBS95_02970 [Alistipes sp.]|nr:hypothetical protein [Candidatus Alistipes equi]
MQIRKFTITGILLLWLCVSGAQELNEEFFAKNPDAAGGIYYGYKYTAQKETAVPKGYKPTYISHYGRHGSRWHGSWDPYGYSIKYLKKANDLNMLTPYGTKLYTTIDRVVKNAKGRIGELTQKGIEEHRGIAQRMFQRYPEIFKGKNRHIEARSTQMPRCILSMSAFTQKLKDLNPKLDIYQTTNEQCDKIYLPSDGRTYSISHTHKVTSKEIDSVIRSFTKDIFPRIFKAEFNEELNKHSREYGRMLRTLFYTINIMQDTEGDVRVKDLFTPRQLMLAWEKVSKNRYATFSNCEEYGDGILYDGSIIIEDVLNDAEDMFSNGGRVAFLRFGHDVGVMAILDILKVEGKSVRTSFNDPKLKEKWVDFKIAPMATNIQWIFYKNRRDDVIVKVLHNEQECYLPIKSDIAPYYHWNDMKQYMQQRITEVRALPLVQKILAEKK